MNAVSNLLNQWITSYIGFVIRFRYAVVVISILAMALLGYQAKNLGVEGSFKYFFEEHNEQLQAFHNLEDIFTKLDSTIIAIQPLNESIASPRILKLVHEVTEKLWTMPYTNRVDSITNYQYTYADGDDLYVENLLQNPEQLTEQRGQEIIDIALSRPELVSRLISVENNVLAITARGQIEPGDNKASKEAATFAYALRAELREAYPDVNIIMSGLIPRNYTYYIAPIKDVSLLMPIILGILIVVMWLLTRSFTSSLVTIGLILLASGAAMGSGALLGIPMSSVAGSAPIIIFTIAIADSIHILMSYLVALGKTTNRHEALLQSMQLNVQPVLLTTVTTGIGFLSLNFSDSPPYQDLGNFCALGTFFAWFLSMTYLPAILAIFPIKANAVVARQLNGVGVVSRWILKNKNRLFFIAVISTVLAITQLSKLEFNDDFLRTFSSKVDADAELKFITENLSGPFQNNYIFDSGKPYGITDPAYLRHLEKFAAWLKTQPEVIHVQSVVETFKNLNRSMNGDDETYYRVADSSVLNAQYLLLYEMSLPFGLDINDQINIDKSSTRFDVSTRPLKTRNFLEFGERTDQWIMENLPPQLHAQQAGIIGLFSAIGINNFESMKFSMVAAFLMISTCIGLSLGSLRLGLVSIVPNTIPIVIVFGAYAFSGQDLGVWTPFVISTALGLIVDATVHLLSKYNYARKQQGLTPEQSIEYSFETVGMALWVSTLILVLGFSILYFAVVVMLQYLGVGTALIVLLALIVDFMVLPVLLITSEKIRLPKLFQQRAV